MALDHRRQMRGLTSVCEAFEGDACVILYTMTMNSQQTARPYLHKQAAADKILRPSVGRFALWHDRT